MENHISFVSILSLQELALRRAVINLWNEPDVLAFIEKFFALFPHAYYSGISSGRRFYKKSHDYLKKWHQYIESKIADQMVNVCIDKSLVNEMLPLITPIGLQINMWKGFHEHYLNFSCWKAILEKDLIKSCIEFDRTILSKLCWTSEGQVDYGKTARKLIIHETVDVVRQYILACLYCLDDFIPNLWQKLPEEIKLKLYNNGDISQIKEPQLEFCWPYILKGLKGNKAFLKFLTKSDSMEEESKLVHNRFLQLLHEIYLNYQGKRSLENETLNNAKKLYSNKKES